MCGISAVIDFAPSRDSMIALERMHRPIRHRGPDDERFLAIGADLKPHLMPAPDPLPGVPVIAALAFRRLRIIDLSEAAAQPMASPSKRVWICFNGEIYNFRTLRRRLEGLGRRFSSDSDTEVALAAYEQWGTRCFEELDGMWAIVILDLDRRVAVVSRDRFGIKPLYWAVDGSRLLLASEIKQILAARAERPAPNEPLIATFLRGNRVPALDETFFRGVTSFPASTFAEVPFEGGRPEPKKYWDLASIAQQPRDYPAAVAEVETAMRNAVETHNVADVNVGYLVSGGLDSSLLAALMADEAAKKGESPAPGFSFGFRERAPGFCELQFADAVARRHNLALHTTTVDPQWVGANAGRVMRAVEEPVLGLPALAQFRIFEFCREQGMTVVIDGEASDEIFAGYPSYQFNLLRDYAQGGQLLRFAHELRAIARRSHRTSIGVLAHFASLRLRRAKPMEWIDSEYGASNNERRRELAAARGDHGTDTSRVGRQLFRDVKWGNVKIVLGYTDRVSMAHSIEARVPYLDLAVVNLAFSLPEEFKVGDGDRKRVLRDVARRYLPPDVTERADRMGFAMPYKMLLEGIRDDVRDRILGIAAARPFRRPSVEKLVSDFRDLLPIWRIYALARWSEEFGVAL